MTDPVLALLSLAKHICITTTIPLSVPLHAIHCRIFICSSHLSSIHALSQHICTLPPPPFAVMSSPAVSRTSVLYAYAFFTRITFSFLCIPSIFARLYPSLVALRECCSPQSPGTPVYSVEVATLQLLPHPLAIEWQRQASFLLHKPQHVTDAERAPYPYVRTHKTRPKPTHLPPFPTTSFACLVVTIDGAPCLASASPSSSPRPKLKLQRRPRAACAPRTPSFERPSSDRDRKGVRPSHGRVRGREGRTQRRGRWDAHEARANRWGWRACRRGERATGRGTRRGLQRLLQVPQALQGCCVQGTPCDLPSRLRRG